jgi:hypothetical protein
VCWNLPGGCRWLRWDEPLPDVCPECGPTWPDHPGAIELHAVDGHLGRVLPECEAPDTRLGPSAGPDLRLGLRSCYSMMQKVPGGYRGLSYDSG